MTIDKLNPKLLKTTGASDGDALVYVSANGQKRLIPICE